MEDPEVQGWNGLRLKLRQGLDSAGKFYQQQSPQSARLSVLLMRSLTGTHTLGNGKFGLTLLTGVGLWCAIGWWRCR
ncbi:MAG: hypothetical protein RM347_033035 [Nostoc sp. ChiQUE02]|uniref:hypothetical protein n=1 Tax=Nostoc sp. ChiQUE02 TaxID=3075377 RepID=UPI002AD396C9|nr:hypothetical protein [Nostoc sp. ChiQUE02]MDZ8233500.1 hypothetical protein [Nostoc sp. ChiQUE02]